MTRGICAALFLVSIFASAADADAPVAPTPAVAELQRENEALRKRIAALEAELAALRERLGLAEAKQSDLAAENRRLEELAGMTAKGEAVASSAALIRSTFNQDTGRTTVHCVPEKLEHLAGPIDTPHTVRFSYSYDGREMTSPPTFVSMTITAVGQTRRKYEHLDTVELTIDGEPRTVTVAATDAEAHRSATSRVGLTRYTETVRLDLSEGDLIALGRGRGATATLGSVELRLPPDVLATARAMRERILLRQ